MKFLLAAFLLVIGTQSVFAQAGAKNDPSMRTRCSYFADQLSLNCSGPSGKVVECKAADMFPMRFKIAGITIPKEQSVQFRKFDLHPLRQDNVAWLNNIVKLNGSSVQFSLYQSRLIRDAGFHLRDADCFDRLAELFNASVANLEVPVTSEPIAPLKAEDLKERISFIGEIFWFERSFDRAPVRNVRSMMMGDRSMMMGDNSMVMGEKMVKMAARAPVAANRTVVVKS